MAAHISSCAQANLPGARRTRCGLGVARHYGEGPCVECASRSLQTKSTNRLSEESPMATYGLIEYAEAGPEVRAVYDDIMATRNVDWINNFWKAIAHDPVLLKRTWESIKQIMAPGAIDPLVKEMIYVAERVTTGCNYSLAS